MTAEDFRHVARKLETYAAIYTGDKEARRMAVQCRKEADALDRAAAMEAMPKSAKASAYLYRWKV